MEALLLSIIAILLLRLSTRTDKRRMRLRTLSVNGTVIDTWRIVIPLSFINKQVGLLNHCNLAPNHGLLLKSRRIHVEGMLFPIDVIALDQSMKVIKISRFVPPNTSVPAQPKSTRYVLELAAGASEALRLLVGDQLNFGDAP